MSLKPSFRLYSQLKSMMMLSVAFLLFYTPSQGKVVHGSKRQYLASSTFPSTTRCTLALDIANIIDVTESQFNKIDFIKSEMEMALEQILLKHPDALLSLSTFTDKPIPPFGYDTKSWTDYCLKIRTTFTTSLEEHNKALSSIRVGGGMDFAESQLDALARAALTPLLDWRKGDRTEAGRVHFKLLVLITDAMFHRPRGALDSTDYLSVIQKFNAPSVANAVKESQVRTENLVPLTPFNRITLMEALRESADNIARKTVGSFNRKTFVSEDPRSGDPSFGANARCTLDDYPSVREVAQIIKDYHYLPVFIVAPAVYRCGPNRSLQCPYPELEVIADKMQNPIYKDPLRGMEALYTNLLEEMDVTGIIQTMEPTYEGLGKALLAALDELSQFPEHCNFKPNLRGEPKQENPPVEQRPASKGDPQDCDLPCGDINVKVSVSLST